MELWARFGPTNYEDFDESLTKLAQERSLRDYQKEFERLGNKVQGWTQKHLKGNFLGGLKPKIVGGVRMFKPKTLKDALNLTQMKDDQLCRQRRANKSELQPIYQLLRKYLEMRCRGDVQRACALIAMRNLFMATDATWCKLF
jgi:hypothetical protein